LTLLWNREYYYGSEIEMDSRFPPQKNEIFVHGRSRLPVNMFLFRQAIRGVILLLVVLTGCSLFGLHWFWKNSNELLRQRAQVSLQKLLPGYEIALGAVKFDWNRQINLYDLSIGGAEQPETLVQIPEAILLIDGKLFAESQSIDVQKIHLLNPVVNVSRDQHGRWSWMELPVPKSTKKSLPEWLVDELTVNITIHNAIAANLAALPAATKLRLMKGNFQVIPAGKRQMIAKGSTTLEHAGDIAIDARIDMTHGAWSVEGALKKLNADQKLLELAMRCSPQLQTYVARVHAHIQQTQLARLKPDHTRMPQRTPFRVASQEQVNSTEMEPDNNVDARQGDWQSAEVTEPELGVSAAVDLEFQAAQKANQSSPTFEVRGEIRNGELDNILVPFPLRQINGSLLWNNDEFTARSFAAKNGITEIELDAQVDRLGDGSQAGNLKVACRNLRIDDRLQGYLPETVEQQYDEIRPTGVANMELIANTDDAGEWQLNQFRMTSVQGTVRHQRFPYLIRDVEGTIELKNHSFFYNYQGLAGQQIITLDGSSMLKQIGTKAYFDIRVSDLPIDEEFIAACPDGADEALRLLNLTGQTDIRLQVFREDGGSQFHHTINGNVKNGTIQFKHFPYRMSALQGDVSYSSQTNAWELQNLKARNGAARFGATGRYQVLPKPGRLDVSIDCKSVAIDQQLQAALSWPLTAAWRLLSPSGTMDALVTLGWVPGKPLLVSLPRIQVGNANIKLEPFPIPLSEVNLKGNYTPGRLSLNSFSARHHQMQIRGRGALNLADNGTWQLRFNQFICDDLQTDRVFLRALPIAFRQTVQAMNIKGPISYSGLLEFRGTQRPEDPFTAAWDIETIFANNAMTAGLDINNIHGRSHLRGTWDGQQMKVLGVVDLKSAEVLGHQFTQIKGPFRISGLDLIIGSERLFNNGVDPQNVSLNQRISGNAIDGLFTLDALAKLTEKPSYHAKVTMSQGKLEDYISRYVKQPIKARGLMNGWMDVHGQGDKISDVKGRGQLQISPAALYELPVMAQMFKVLSFVPPDRTAFNYALLDFDILQQQFLFKTIDLVGDAISFRGRGITHFDGRVSLDFYSRLRRSQIPIPILNTLLGQAAQGLVGVQVRGTIYAPIANVKTAPALDETMKRFLSVLESPQTLVPRLAVPSPVAPPQRRSQQSKEPTDPARSR